MNSSLLPVGLIVCAAAGAALWWWPVAQDPAPATPPATSVEKKADPETPVLNARWTAPEVVQNPDRQARRHMVQLPTGEFVKALNGAVDAKPLDWPKDRPFSPILGTERAPDGTEWWVHADGSKSTTVMIYRSDLGRHDAVSQVANPEPPLPMEPEEMSRPRTSPSGQGDEGGSKVGEGVGSQATKTSGK